MKVSKKQLVITFIISLGLMMIASWFGGQQEYYEHKYWNEMSESDANAYSYLCSLQCWFAWPGAVGMLITGIWFICKKIVEHE